MKPKPAIEGGNPAFSSLLIFGKPVLGEEEVNAVSDVIRSGWLGTGEKCEEFERKFANKVQAKYAVAVSSCTAAIHASLVARGIGQGDEVITTPLTFIATVSAIVQTGATPVLADIDPITLNVDPDEVDRHVTSRTKAIVPVHFAGLPCYLHALRGIAFRYNLKIVEDAAHALGARYDGRPIGAYHTTCFSFYPNKNITTGEGGMITTGSERVADRLRSVRLHGLSRDAYKRFHSKSVTFSDAVDVGFKYNMTDMQAALGLVQLGRLDEFLEKRRSIADGYDEVISSIPGLVTRPRPWGDKLRHAQHLYVVEVDESKFGLCRNTLLQALRAENIGAGVHYKAVHLHPYYERTLRVNPTKLPHATRLSSSLLSLPLSPAMSQDDVGRVGLALWRIHNYYAK